MAQNTANLIVTELDFDRIKANIKNYMRGQTTFRDYDFEGSGLSVMLDVLAYNTHYLAFYANMIFNEMFLDSAVTRGPVVSRAAELNYVPRSYVASTATINVTFFPDGDPSPAIIEKGTQFITEIDDTSFQFVTTQAYNVFPTDGAYSKDIEISQGTFLTFNYTVDTDDLLQKFTIPNENVDLRFLTVVVKDNINDAEGETYTLTTDVTDLDGDSLVYFLRENPNGLFEVYFGNDVIGKAVQNGNIVSLTYLLTDGSSANGAQIFSRVGSVGGSNVVAISIVSNSAGGAEKETIESIKFLAPKFYESQNRGITKNDYIAIVLREYPTIDAVSVWGGEDNDPPMYGRVFLALKPRVGVVLSNTVKEAIKTRISSKYSVLSIRPEIVDPDYLYVLPTCRVTYDSQRADVTSGELETLVRQGFIDYFDTNLTSFGANLRFSDMVATIDDLKPWIVGNVTTLKIQKRVTPTLGTRTQYTIDFSNPITPGSLSTNQFNIGGINYRLRDVPTTPTGSDPYTTGIIETYRTVNNSTIILNSTQGTINYITGKIVLSSLTILSIVVNDELRLTVQPVTQDNVVSGVDADYDIHANGREMILQLDEDNISVVVEALET